MALIVVKAARSVPLAVVGHHKGKIQTWNHDTGECLAEFTSVYSGYQRLAMSPYGEAIVAANWNSGPSGGVACYRSRTGDVLWHRADLGSIHNMRFSEQGSWIWCEVEAQPALCLDQDTGETLNTWPTVDQVFDSAFSRDLLLVGAAGFSIGLPEKHTELPAPGHSFRHAAFSPESVIVCENHLVRCLRTDDAEELWRYVPPPDEYLWRVSFQSDNFFYALQSTKPVDFHRIVTLMRFALDGTAEAVCRLGSLFPHDGFGHGVFVGPDGDVVSLQSGQVLQQLQFPTSQCSASPR